MELSFDGLYQLIQGQSVTCVLALAMLIQSVAMLVLCFKLRGRR
jgi:hypothetical protein